MRTRTLTVTLSMLASAFLAACSGVTVPVDIAKAMGDKAQHESCDTSSPRLATLLSGVPQTAQRLQGQGVTICLQTMRQDRGFCDREVKAVFSPHAGQQGGVLVIKSSAPTHETKELITDFAHAFSETSKKPMVGYIHHEEMRSGRSDIYVTRPEAIWSRDVSVLGKLH